MANKRLTVFLLRNVQSFSEAVVHGGSASTVELDPASGVDGVFYSQARPATRPSWVSFVSKVLPATPASLMSSSASGLLLLRTDDRFFALTFGYGRSLLNPSKIESGFGMRVALNRIDPRQIRSMDTKTFEDMVVTKKTHVSKSAELPSFGVDVSRDILRAVTGEPRDTSFAKRLSGSDALVLNTTVEATELPRLCSELLRAYGEDAYKADFGWIDHLSLVVEADAVEALDRSLVDQIRAGDTSSVHLAMPESLEWEDVDAFRITGTRKREYDDLDLDEYLANVADRHEMTIDLLKSRQVSVRFSRSVDFDARWSLYQCLVAEQRIGVELFVLIEGRWFKVSESLVTDVDAFAASLPSAEIDLPSAMVGETEGAYNRRVVDENPSNLLLLDAHIKRPGGATSGIELCDVLSRDGEFVHVKRKSRSSTLSHLFAQGSVSAMTFISDGPFRDAIRKTIEQQIGEGMASPWLDLVPAGGLTLDRSRYTVSFVVITNSSRPGTDWLPFFSKLNLMQHGRQLHNLGFRVSVSRVNMDTPPLSPDTSSNDSA